MIKRKKNAKKTNCSIHSMATANQKKSEDFMTNTTAASKYIPKGQLISKTIYGVLDSPKKRTKTI